VIDTAAPKCTNCKRYNKADGCSLERYDDYRACILDEREFQQPISTEKNEGGVTLHLPSLAEIMEQQRKIKEGK
jgi:hypothetical protein